MTPDDPKTDSSGGPVSDLRHPDMDPENAPHRIRVQLADDPQLAHVTDDDGRELPARSAELVADDGRMYLRLLIPLSFVDITAPQRRNPSNDPDPVRSGRRDRPGVRRPAGDR